MLAAATRKTRLARICTAVCVQKKALSLVLQRMNVFITGQAGTGKTVLLRAIIDGTCDGICPVSTQAHTRV